MRCIPMKKAYVLALSFTAAFATIAFADGPQAKLATAQIPPKIQPPVGRGKIGFVLRQDLFDRNDPNNLRSDYHGPPAQPGQF
jgi:hypothetical protein